MYPSPQPPQNPAPRQPARRGWLGGGCGTLLIICAVAAVLGAIHPSGDTASNSTSAYATDTSIPPTATPKGPHAISGPYLGGTADAFVAAFGQPTDSYGKPYYPFTTSGGLSGGVCFCDAVAGTDGQQRLDILSISVPGIDYSQAPGILARFLPPDGHSVTTISDPNLGPIRVYQSADLALSFPAAAFTDSNGGGRVPPGTFSVACEQPSQQDCTMVTGE